VVCRQVTKEQFDDLIAQVDAEKARRAAAMPTEQDALNQAHEAYLRLKELGWNDATYCPKDGREFDSIEFGSSGIHRCHYMGEWPDGHWWVAEAGDLWLARPSLYRVEQEEKDRWAAAGKKLREMRDRGEFD